MSLETAQYIMHTRVTFSFYTPTCRRQRTTPRERLLKPQRSYEDTCSGHQRRCIVVIPQDTRNKVVCKTGQQLVTKRRLKIEGQRMGHVKLCNVHLSSQSNQFWHPVADGKSYRAVNKHGMLSVFILST